MHMALLPDRVRPPGLVLGPGQRRLSDADFDAEVDKLISRLMAGPALAIAKTKNAINAATLTEVAPSLREWIGQALLLRTDEASPRAQRHSSGAGPPCSPAVERSGPASGRPGASMPILLTGLQLLVGHVCRHH